MAVLLLVRCGSTGVITRCVDCSRGSWYLCHHLSRLGCARQDGTGEDEASNSNALPHKGVIKVTIQYRMGVFGHFARPEMGAVNVGTLDQIAALEWIQENIVSPSPNHSLAAPRSPVTTTGH